MSLLQIAEPNQSAQPHQHRFGLGIDLGTTRSLAAVVRSGKAQVLPAKHHADTLLPSVVYYPATGAPVVGSEALAHLADDPKNTIISAKRFMGRSQADIKFSHPYELSGSENAMPAFMTAQGDVSPVEVSARILAALNERASDALPADSVEGAVITVPAYFDEAQRQATKDAAQAAGINVLRLLNEPTAAAVAYGLDKPNQDDTESYYLIYDLGGGTFDVSILKLTDGVFEVLATGGNSALGGDDIDRLLVNWLIKQLSIDPAEVSRHDKSILAQQAKTYKQALTDSQQVDVDIAINEQTFQGVLTHEDLHAIAQPVSRRTLAVCEQVLRDAQLSVTDLDEVVLVGGSTRMPTIQNTVAEFFGKQPLSRLNPDEVVALGAAQTAHQLINGNSDNNLLLLDVTPLSLGLETMGGLVEVLIPRNTPIPVKKRQTFTTYQDGQTGLVVHVVQGERETVENCRSLGRFELYGIPPMKAGFARIEVTFSIDANGQLTVSAQETSTGTESQIEITPSYGLSDEQKEQLLVAGFKHAEEDKNARSLIETKVEAERELLALQSALGEFDSLLTAEAKQALTTQMQALQEALAHDDLANIEAQQAKLKPLSDAFAASIMNQSVKTSMAGTSAKDW
ncbi:MAG: Fe-S protein assembly chaperone HscA [Psychrobacter sp.]|jgi:molecular chaperone HscA|uniref:Fe-S protein assembly chaperone HscA n=1 Tax=uncultured Psychrobacter sp. TaxID=259303 RepID=UPI000C59FB16|nr:Fe-S protein assembly chaperone HscA [Psychrobacter sp.]